MYKKLIKIAAVFLIIAMLTGCGAGSKNSEGDSSAVNSNVSTEPAEIEQVWRGPKKDFIIEYLLMFTSKRDVYVLKLSEGTVKSIEKGTYTYDKEMLELEGITLLSNFQYSASSKTITATDDMYLLFGFKPDDTPIYDQKTLDELMIQLNDGGSSSEEHTEDHIEGWPTGIPEPTNVGVIDKKYAYAKSIQLDYTNYDAARMQEFIRALRDNGFTVEVEEFDHESDATKDAEGNPSVTHNFIAGKGEVVHNVLRGDYLNGYYIKVQYREKEAYDGVPGTQPIPPMARIYLTWEDLSE